MCIITNKQNGKFSDFSSGLLRSARNDEVENRNDDSGVFQSISKKIVGLRNMTKLCNDSENSCIVKYIVLLLRYHHTIAC